MAVALAELDLFHEPKEQLQIEREITTEHLSWTAISDAKNPISFIVPLAENEYCNLTDLMMKLMVRFTLTKTKSVSGADTIVAVEANDLANLCPVRGLFNALFKSVDLEINGKLITTPTQLYAYEADLKTHLMFSKDAKNSHLTAVGWIDDDKDNKNAIVAARSRMIQLANASTGLTKTITLMGKPLLDICNQPRLLKGNCTIKLTFHPTTNPNFYFMVKPATTPGDATSEAARLKLHVAPEFVAANLFVRRSVVTPQVIEGHLAGLTKAPAKYYFTRTETKQFAIPSGLSQTIIDNCVLGILPRRAVIAFVKHDDFTGSTLNNPFNYQHFDINYLCCYADGVSYPARPLTPDFENNDYVRSYFSIFEAYNDHYSDSTYVVPYEQYKNGNVLFGINFSNDASNGYVKSGYVSPPKTGSLRLEVKFKNALPQPINCIMMLEYDAKMEINAAHEVNTNYN